MSKKKKQEGPKIFVFDVETSPLISYTWGLWQQDVGLNQIKQDWFIMSWAGKFVGEDKMYYADQRNNKKIGDDKKILQELWKLLDESDIILTQNGKSFDIKRVNARMLEHGMKPYSSVKHIDTKQIAKSKFGFTSNKLEYMTKKFNKKYTKLDHGKFPGMKLWVECLAGNKAAWKEMEKYNKYDVLALEELYLHLRPWVTSGSNHYDPNLYTDDESIICSCGSKSFNKNGYSYTSTGKFQRYVCKKCGKESRSKVNLLTKEKKETLRK